MNHSLQYNPYTEHLHTSFRCTPQVILPLEDIVITTKM